MFFDVTRVGTDRRLRVAVAAIAYLDTLPSGSVLHLVGGQSLQVSETATEIEERALAARPITAVECDGRRVECGSPKPATIDWTEVLASPIGAPAAEAAIETAPTPRRQRRDRAK